MITYLLKSAACLALLLFFYHLVLEKEKMHNFNRFYLLAGVIISFLIPLATITTYVEPIIAAIEDGFIQPFTSTTSIEDSIHIIQENSINYTQIAIYFYAFITLVLLLRFGLNLFKITRKTKIYEIVMHQKAKLVLVDDKILPHTFWNYIFINKEDYENKKIEQELFTHELTHVTQKHTLDVLLIEFLQAIFWINPIFLFVKKAIQLNHEFLADETVINQYKNTFQYQHLLLNKAAWKNEYYLASNLNYSLTKKRLTMMTTQSSPTRILLKKLAVIPLLTGFVFLFAERVEAQKKQEIKEEPIEIIEEDVPFKKEDLSKSEIYKEYYNSKGFFIIKDKNGKQISKKYSELTKEEKKRLAPPLPLKSKKKVPTQKLIDQLKDGKKYAIWIDGKVVKNDVLNNYKASDFSSHSVSFVYKNARSKRFPQNYQASLSTHKHFKAENDKRQSDFLKFVQEKHNTKEIKIIKSPTKEEKKNNKKHNLPSSKSSKQSISNTQSISEAQKLINKLELNYIKNENLEKYNSLAKKYNAIPIEKRIIPLKDLNTLETLYNKLSKEEKKNIQPFPECYLPNKKVVQEKPKFHKNWFITIDGQKYYYTFDKNERIARYYKNGKIVNLDIVKEYKKKNKIYEKLKATGKHYVFKSENAKKEIDREFSDLGGMYFRMPRVDKNKVSRPKNRIKPYVKLRKGDKIWYKKRSELTEEDKLLLPPPPPRPNATKEEIKRSKKAYHDWKKRVGINTPPPPKPVKIEVIKEKANKTAYLNKYKKYESLRHQKPHFIRKSKKDKKSMSDLWLELRQMYIYDLSKNDKKTVELPVSPFLPYIKIHLNGKSYYKVSNQLTAEELKTSIGAPEFANNHRSALNLLDNNDPIIIPIGNYKLQQRPVKKLQKNNIIIAISKNGEYYISKDTSFKNFEKITLSTIDNLLSKLSKKEIKNTFVFAKSRDLNKFRSKLSNSPEYQDDIEIQLIKNDIRFTILKGSDNKYKEFPITHFVLDNKKSKQLQERVQKIAKIFKKYGITNMTI